jgi:formylglycine-generating enzyme required for sulfatase activity
LFPIDLNEKGVDAHLHYQKNLDELKCINCHLKTGHYHDEPDEQFVILDETEPEVEEELAPLITELPEDAFTDYTEMIPGSSVRLQMVAIEGGQFTMGSPEEEVGRSTDEGPPVDVQLDRFWMGKYEVSWREFDAYYAQTVTRGKNESGQMTDAIAGPTPPYGSPDQGWGKGTRPAITMTHYSARKFCEWLSLVTGRKYRLPTEAEWEYVARAGTQGAYPMDVELPSWFDSWMGQLMGGPSINTERLGEYAWFKLNSGSKTHPRGTTSPNPWGVCNMLGNAAEFCADWYDPAAYSSYAAGRVVNPRGPETGREHVIRGGSYKSNPGELRSAARAHTEHDAWMKTDPQTPKSVWWFSDCNDVGFRVVREEASE